MKLARMGEPGNETPVAISDEGICYSLSSIAADIDGPFLEGGGIGRARTAMEGGVLPRFDATNVRRGSPVARPGMLVCIGMNYRQHAIETSAEIPSEPIVFMKSSRCVIGPDDVVLVPRGSVKTDWEVELAVIIGARAHYLDSPSSAGSCIAGYAISNDVSEREFQLERGGQWVKGKSCDTFNPLGPWLVPADEVDGRSLGMYLWVNDELRQSSTTADMIFDVDHIVWYLSQFMVLEAGDVINTGTPAGVALGLPGQPYLRVGDRMKLVIDGLGEQNQTLASA